MTKQKKEPAKPANTPTTGPVDLNQIQLTPEMKERLEQTKQKLEKFKKQVLEKFDKYVTGIALLPPPRGAKPEEKDHIHVLTLIDDTEPSKMPKFELKQKLSAIIAKIAQDLDKNLIPQTLLLTELWQNCYDAKYELLQDIALAAPIHDTGMLSALKLAEVHKSMVLKKFEKYIVAYVFAGSLVQGKATSESDVDVYIVIDDTDVKKMTRVELKDKLRAIIIGMGLDAGQLTGIKNKLNIQPYILTDFWDSVKEANPVIFTFLRDGVPLYDRGIFMPWKQLLKMGKVKPSAEAIDMYMSGGEQMLERSKYTLRNIALEDFFWAILTPSQAALMLYGMAPPTPKETPEVLREVFVKKEQLLTDKDVDTLEQVIKIRKDIEHGTKKDVTGKEVDDLLDACDKYLKRIRKLFTQIESIKEKENLEKTYDAITHAMRDVLRLEGKEKIPEADLVRAFEDDIVSTGKVPSKYLRMVNNLIQAKTDYDKGKLTKADTTEARKESHELLKYLIEWTQRKRSRELAQSRLRIKHGSKYGEVILLGNTAFVIENLDAEDKTYQKANINNDGGLGPLEKSTPEAFEEAIGAKELPERTNIKAGLFNSLEKIFGKDVEVITHY